ncbi:MAG: PAS domain-containing protein [Candidatus Dechloromonas phosphoritropha]
MPCDQVGESCLLRQSLEAGVPQRVLHLHHTPRGEEHVDVKTRPIHNDQGQIVYSVETMRVVRQGQQPGGAGAGGKFAGLRGDAGKGTARRALRCFGITARRDGNRQGTGPPRHS